MKRVLLAAVMMVLGFAIQADAQLTNLGVGAQRWGASWNGFNRIYTNGYPGSYVEDSDMDEDTTEDDWQLTSDNRYESLYGILDPVSGTNDCYSSLEQHVTHSPGIFKIDSQVITEFLLAKANNNVALEYTAHQNAWGGMVVVNVGTTWQKIILRCDIADTANLPDDLGTGVINHHVWYKATNTTPLEQGWLTWQWTDSDPDVYRFTAERHNELGRLDSEINEALTSDDDAAYSNTKYTVIYLAPSQGVEIDCASGGAAPYMSAHSFYRHFSAGALPWTYKNHSTQTIVRITAASSVSVNLVPTCWGGNWSLTPDPNDIEYTP